MKKVVMSVLAMGMMLGCSTDTLVMETESFLIRKEGGLTVSEVEVKEYAISHFDAHDFGGRQSKQQSAS